MAANPLPAGAGDVEQQEQQVRELLNSLKTKTVTESVRMLIAAFGNPTWIVRKRASEAMVKVGERAVPELQKALPDPCEDIRYWSIRTLGCLGAAGVTPLLEVLGKGEYRMQLFAVEALGKSDDPRAVKALVRSLGSSNWAVCNASSTELAAIGKTALKFLGQVLRQKDETRRYWATITLGRMGKTAVTALKRFTRAKDKQVRFSAARAIGEAREKECIESLIELLDDEYMSVRKAAADSLVSFGVEAVPSLLGSIKRQDSENSRWVVRVLVRIGPPVIRPLLEIIKEDLEDIYDLVTEVMEKIGSKGASALVELMRDQDPHIRAHAAQYAAGAEGEGIIPSLIERLDDKSWPVRRHAAESLVKFGSQALEVLARAIEADNTNVRYWTTKVLARLGGDALDPLIRALSDEKEDIRMFASWALGEAGEEKGVPALIGALKDPFWTVRKSVAEALKKLQLLSVPYLIKSLNHPNPDVRYWVARVIEDIGKLAVEPLIDVLLKDQDQEMRFFAAYALSAIPDSRSIAPLAIALEGDVNDWVRKYAATGLGKIGKDEAIDILIASLGKQREDVEHWLIEVVAGLQHPSLQGKLLARFSSAGRAQAASIARILGARGEATAVPNLIRFLGSEDELLIAAAAHALQAIGTSAIPHLLGALGNENWSIRSESAGILVHFGQEAREQLEQAAGSTNKNVSYWAAHALRQMKQV